MNQPQAKKSLKIEVKKDSFTIHTDSNKGDIEMLGLLVVLIISVLGIVVMYKINKKETK